MTPRLPRSTGLSTAAVGVLAVVAAGAIADGYALQPALATIAHNFHVTTGSIAAVVTAGVVGYLLGLALLVPLVDHLAPRRLVSGQLAVLAAVLVLAANAPSPFTLIMSFLFVGAATTVAAVCSALVGCLAAPDHRGRQIATIATGISAGILLSRFIGGFLTDLIGWRGMLLASAGFALLAAVAVRPLLPGVPLARSTGYLTAVTAPAAALRKSAALRWRTGAGMLWFFAFNLVWVGLALTLAAPPYRLPPAAIGLYSLAGVLGLVVIRPAGRAVDRYGSRRVALTGLAVATASALVLLATIGQPLTTGIALAFFDAGCFTAQVATQTSVTALDPNRSGTLNAAYLTGYYAAGAAGTIAAGMASSWSITAGIAALACAAAATSVLLRRMPASRDAIGRLSRESDSNL